MADAMRDKIADICDEEIQSDHPSGYVLADAIINALPDMIPPLVWHQWGFGDGETSTAPVLKHTYSTARSIVNEGMWRLRGPWQNHTYHPTKEAAKAAADAHHVAQIMAALGIAQEGET